MQFSKPCRPCPTATTPRIRSATCARAATGRSLIAIFRRSRSVTQQLTTWLPEELHVYLVELAVACRDDVDRTESLWEQLKRRILECEEAWRPSDH